MNSQNLKSDLANQLSKLLENKSKEIIIEALEVLARTPLKNYEASGIEKNEERLTNLFNFTLESIKSRNLIPIVEYAQKIAKKRHKDNFDLQEIQSAFNALEEIIWKTITNNMSPKDYPEAFGLASTVLGAGKGAVAVEYVSLVSNRKDKKSLESGELLNVI